MAVAFVAVAVVAVLIAVAGVAVAVLTVALVYGPWLWHWCYWPTMAVAMAPVAWCYCHRTGAVRRGRRAARYSVSATRGRGRDRGTRRPAARGHCARRRDRGRGGRARCCGCGDRGRCANRHPWRWHSSLVSEAIVSPALFLPPLGAIVHIAVARRHGRGGHGPCAARCTSARGRRAARSSVDENCGRGTRCRAARGRCACCRGRSHGTRRCGRAAHCTCARGRCTTLYSATATQDFL